MPVQASVKSEMNTVQYHPLRPNVVTAILLLHILWTGFSPPPDLCLSMCKKFSAHGTTSYVVFQNLFTTTVLQTRFPPPDFCPYKIRAFLRE